MKILQYLKCKQGIWAYYGACRFQGEDYMYQVSCAEKSAGEICQPIVSLFILNYKNVLFLKLEA